MKNCQKFIGCFLHNSSIPCIFIHPKEHWPDLMSDLKCTDFCEKYYAVYDLIWFFTNFVLHCPLLSWKIYECVAYIGLGIKFYWWFGSCSRLQKRTVLLCCGLCFRDRSPKFWYSFHHKNFKQAIRNTATKL